MKLTFDVKNDFESTYYLPGYDCKVIIKVSDGIVELNVEDDIDYLDDLELDEVYEKCLESCDNPNCSNFEEFSNCINCIACDPNDNLKTYNEVLATDAYDDEEEDMKYEVEEDVDIKSTEEYAFVQKLAKMDKDGVAIKLLTELLKNKEVTDTASKINKTFNKVKDAISDALKNY